MSEFGIGMTNRWQSYLTILFCTLLFAGCLPERPDRIEPSAFFAELKTLDILPVPLDPENFPVLQNAAPGHSALGLYEYQNSQWALFDLPADYKPKNKLKNSYNHNLHIFSEQPIPQQIIISLNNLLPSIGYEQLGIFAYPLGVCFIISVFITIERLLSLRRGVTFPRKVEKALLRGEFPNKKWKKSSSAERIVHVAMNENPSEETLRAYARLEIAAMERGMYLLEVIVAGAPLIGLLGTVTGLVEVFSQMPSHGSIDKSLFTEGISLALLTTMAGLAIALPTLLFNAFLQRVLDKRAAALDWLTARLVDATDKKKSPAEIVR